MKRKEFVSIGEYFYWCYANMGMAHFALQNGHTQYGKIDYMIRAKLYKGLCTGSMKMQSLYDDEKHKLVSKKCVYCGNDTTLTLDHLIPKSKGGSDSGENIIYCCKKCNSSKNNKDLIDWFISKGQFPPILVLRRYLKLADIYFTESNALDQPYERMIEYTTLYRIDLLPYNFPQPCDLKI